MTTAYNVRQQLERHAAANRQFIADPGASGTVIVTPNALCVLQIDTTGARTLQAAAQVPVGTEVLACATAASVTVNGFPISDGSYALFRVTLDSSAANAWTVEPSNDPDLLAAARKMEVTSIETGADDTGTVTAAMMLKKIIDAVPTGAATFTLSTAALLVAAIPGCAVGDTFRFIITNNSAGANTITVAAGSGGTADGTLTVAQNVVRMFVVTITNVTASSEAYVVYGLG